MLRAVVFDFDGVLVDSEPLHFRCFRQLGAELGASLDYQTYLQTYIGFDDRDAFCHMLTGRAEPADADLEQRLATLIERKHELFQQLAGEGADPIPGAWPLAHEITRALPTAVASGASAGEIALMLAGLGEGGRFDIIVSADDVARSKPDPTSYALAVARLAREKGPADLAPAQCLAIEDTPTGLASAKAAGLATLAVATTRPTSELAEAEADRVVETLEGVRLADLQAWFGAEAPRRPSSDNP